MIFNLTPTQFIKKAKKYFKSHNTDLIIDIFEFCENKHQEHDTLMQTKDKTYMTIMLKDKKYAIECNLSYSQFRNFIYDNL